MTITVTTRARLDRDILKATELFNAGFTTKAAQKDALGYLNTAYSALRGEWFDMQCAAAPGYAEWNAPTDAEIIARRAHFDAELPFDLHQVRERHFDILAIYLPGNALTLQGLADLRAAIKAAPVTPPAKDETKALERKIVESLKDLMARRKVQFLEVIDLAEVLEDGVRLPGVSASSHYVTNEHGTTFLRTFYYLKGKLTPLNVILAGAQEAKRLSDAA